MITLIYIYIYFRTQIAGLAILKINSTKKKSRNLWKLGGSISYFFNVTEEGWVRIRGKREGGGGKIFL